MASGGGRTTTPPNPNSFVVYTVQQEIVIGYAEAVHRDRFVGALVFKYSAADIRAGLSAIGSGTEVCELDKVSPIQRKLGNAPLGLDGAQRRRFCLEKGGAAVTCTDSVAEPTLKAMSTRAVWLTPTSTVDCTAFWKPGFSTVTEYIPMRKRSAAY